MMRTWIAMGILLVSALPAQADVLELKSGERLRGSVTAFDGTTFTIRTGYGVLRVPRTDLVTAVIDGSNAAASGTSGPALTDGTPAGSGAPPVTAGRSSWGLMPEGALAQWNLNGDVSDALGSHPGILRSTGDWQPDRHGQTRSALRFHGKAEEVITVSHGADLTPAQLTLSAWIKGDKPQRWARIIDKFNYVGKTGFALFHHEQKHVLAFQGFGEGGKGIWVESRSTIGKDWMHVVASYDGRVARLYVNGVLEGEANCNVAIRHNEKDLTIGGGFDGSNNFPWSGDLDAIRFFGRTLTTEEVRTLYQEQDGPLGTSDLMHRDRI